MYNEYGNQKRNLKMARNTRQTTLTLTSLKDIPASFPDEDIPFGVAAGDDAPAFGGAFDGTVSHDDDMIDAAESERDSAIDAAMEAAQDVVALQNELEAKTKELEDFRQDHEAMIVAIAQKEAETTERHAKAMKAAIESKTQILRGELAKEKAAHQVTADRMRLLQEKLALATQERDFLRQSVEGGQQRNEKLAAELLTADGSSLIATIYKAISILDQIEADMPLDNAQRGSRNRQDQGQEARVPMWKYRMFWPIEQIMLNAHKMVHSQFNTRMGRNEYGSEDLLRYAKKSHADAVRDYEDAKAGALPEDARAAGRGTEEHLTAAMLRLKQAEIIHRDICEPVEALSVALYEATGRDVAAALARNITPIAKRNDQSLKPIQADRGAALRAKYAGI